MLPFYTFPISFPKLVLNIHYLVGLMPYCCPPSPQKKRKKGPEKNWKKEKTSPIWLLKRKFPITLKKIVEVQINIINLLTKFLQFFFFLNYNLWNTFVTGWPLRHFPLGKLARKAKLPPSPGFPPPHVIPPEPHLNFMVYGDQPGRKDSVNVALHLFITKKL